MKIILPENATARNEVDINGIPGLLVQIPNHTGWDIACKLAQANNIDLSSLAKTADLSVYEDHIMLGNATV